MSFRLDAIGTRGAEHRYAVTDDARLRYAAATDDVPGGPVFAIVPVWETIAPASKSVATEDERRRVVHYEQDIFLHHPLEAGVTVVSHATPVALLGRPNGTSLVIKTETRTEDSDLLNEQYVTEFFRGVETPESVGERAPAHRLDVNGAAPLAEVAYEIAATRPCATRAHRATISRFTSTTSSRVPSGFPVGSCTVFARRRSPVAPFSRQRTSKTRPGSNGLRSGSPRRFSRARS